MYAVKLCGQIVIDKPYKILFDIMYNVNNDICTPMPTGLYVWNGSMWQDIGIESQINHSAENIPNLTTGIGTVTDFEGNEYPTKRWKSIDGTKTSAIWMTKNLHAIRKADGEYIDCLNGLRLNPASSDAATEAVVVKDVIPSGTVTYTNADVAVGNQPYADFVKIFGLKYTLKQSIAACPQG